MAVNLSPIGNGAQYFSVGGLPLSGGFLYTYTAGTSTPQPSYTTSSGAIANTNPIILDAGGRPPAEIWLTAGVAYKFVLTDALGTPIGPALDNISGIGDINNLTASGNTVLGGLDNTLNVAAGALVVSGGNTAVGGNLTVAGNTTLGDAAPDLVTFNAGTVALANTPTISGNPTFSGTVTMSGTESVNNLTVTGSLNAVSGTFTGTLSGFGVAVVAVKSATTSRASTTALTADPHLAIGIVPGTYIIEMWAPVFGTTSGAGGFAGGVFYSGTAAAEDQQSFYGQLNSVALVNTTGPVGSGTLVASATIRASTDVASCDWIAGQAVLHASTAGSLSFRWAQNSSNVNAANVGKGAWLKVTPVS